MTRDRDYPLPGTLAEALAAVVRARYAERGWTIKRLAAESGVEEQQLSRWLLPAKREFRTTDVHKIAIAFGVTASQLFAEAEAKLAEAMYRRHNSTE